VKASTRPPLDDQEPAWRTPSAEEAERAVAASLPADRGGDIVAA